MTETEGGDSSVERTDDRVSRVGVGVGVEVGYLLPPCDLPGTRGPPFRPFFYPYSSPKVSITKFLYEYPGTSSKVSGGVRETTGIERRGRRDTGTRPVPQKVPVTPPTPSLDQQDRLPRTGTSRPPLLSETRFSIPVPKTGITRHTGHVEEVSYAPALSWDSRGRSRVSGLRSRHETVIHRGSDPSGVREDIPSAFRFSNTGRVGPRTLPIPVYG